MQTVQKNVFVVDVLVIYSEQVPSVQRFESKVPQIQSITRVADIPVVLQKPVENPPVQFLVVLEVVDMPVFSTTGAELVDKFLYFPCQKWTPTLRPLPWSSMAVHT